MRSLSGTVLCLAFTHDPGLRLCLLGPRYRPSGSGSHLCRDHAAPAAETAETAGHAERAAEHRRVGLGPDRGVAGVRCGSRLMRLPARDRCRACCGCRRAGAFCGIDRGGGLAASGEQPAYRHDCEPVHDCHRAGGRGIVSLRSAGDRAKGKTNAFISMIHDCELSEWCRARQSGRCAHLVPACGPTRRGTGRPLGKQAVRFVTSPCLRLACDCLRTAHADRGAVSQMRDE